ncbi:MAG: cadherin-like domain-containing protein [Bdellovibrionales bacterium]|nr:cadherin-like domain-containing protein [Oligoflexia bacterium]
MSIIKQRNVLRSASALALSFSLSACVFGDHNKQFFEPHAALIRSPGSIIEVAPVVGESPVAQNDGPFEIAQNQTFTLPVEQLLANDSDPRGLPLHLSAFEAATSGELTLNGNTFTFRPLTDFVGVVSFKYQIQNGANLSASASASINVRKPATEVMYGHTGTTLYLYDAFNHTTSAIANFSRAVGRPTTVFDIAITANGLMYGVDGTSLYYIEASTGVMTEVFNDAAAFGNINGLTALSDGRLVLSGDGVAIFDLTTQKLSTLLAPSTYQSAGDIIALPDGFLYMAAMAAGSDHLIKIDPASGQTQDVGSLGRLLVYGLGYANSTFYGFGFDGTIFQINQNNASTTTLSNTNVNWNGATTNPVLW